MRKLKLLVIPALLIGVALAGWNLSQTSAQSADYTKYIWEYAAPFAIQSDASELQTRLDSEVQKIIAAGHLAPYRAIFGEEPAHFFWYNRYDVVYTLSMALPYLPANTRTNAITYLQTEMNSYPLWNAGLLPANVGTRREPVDLFANEQEALLQDYNTRPQLFALYALWLYANNSGNWSYIDSNWTSITNFYNSRKNLGEINKHYNSIAGAIGYARLARFKTSPDSNAYNTAVADINNGFNAGKNFYNFALNAENAYKWSANGWDWTRNETFLGWHFNEITPETGRYLYDDTNLRTKVLGGGQDFAFSIPAGSVNNETYYSLRRGEYLYPLWFIGQAPAWSRYFGEGSGVPPDAKLQIFGLKAFVQRLPAYQLRSFVDVPFPTLGDFYYIQNVVRTIQAYGTECWYNLLGALGQCGSQAPKDVELRSVHFGNYLASGNGVLRLTVKNVGVQPYSGNVSTSYTLAPGMSLTSTASTSFGGAGWACNNSGVPVTVVCNANVAVNAGVSSFITLTVGLTGIRVGTVLNTSGNVSITGDQYSANNVASDSGTVLDSCSALPISATADDGSSNFCGTLSYALTRINPDNDTITFSPAISRHTLYGRLPTLPANLKIDGGCDTYNAPFRNNLPRGIPGVAILAAEGADDTGLRLAAGSNIKGVAIGKFSKFGIDISGANNQISCTWVGTADGVNAVPNGVGIRLNSTATDTRLGLPGTAFDNGVLVSGNQNAGIQVLNATRNELHNAWVGLKKDGNSGIRNYQPASIIPPASKGGLKLGKGNIFFQK